MAIEPFVPQYQSYRIPQSARCSIPSPEAYNWTDPQLNNFRQNVQTWGVHNAPNLAPELFGADNRDCLDGIIRLGLMVENKGSKGVPAGVNVGFYREDDNGGHEPIGSKQTTQTLLPGMMCPPMPAATCGV